MPDSQQVHFRGGEFSVHRQNLTGFYHLGGRFLLFHLLIFKMPKEFQLSHYTPALKSDGKL